MFLRKGAAESVYQQLRFINAKAENKVEIKVEISAHYRRQDD